MNDPMATAGYEMVTLEWLKAAVTQTVSAEVAASLTLDQFREHILGRLVYQLGARILAEQLPPEHVERTAATTFEAPDGWWQVWKAEHPRLWRGWLLKRWPVRMAEHRRTATLSVDVRRYWTFPEQRRFMPEFGRPVRVVILDTSLEWTP